ncbi:Aminotransferase class I and II [Aspergillus parasiticus SU-1]|uniref:Aminotransferase class I and II n=1 Tax=Aspergillus parasiticus (strain ATCC 56775 / NRRL 5862 / SRRC 143 / SU-1) TaxID=1403190 RepID=A0A0F0ILV5_ASPPU|nr:Aminotransferase class I and II [Aspergillus parasiticus SU-1]
MASSMTISARGVAFAEKRPLFFDVLDNLWHPESNPDGIVNLGLAENALLHPELVDFINSQRLDSPHALTYGDGFSGSKSLHKALCRFLNRQFRPRVLLEPTAMVVTAGASNAVECCAWSLFESGDYVLMGRPYWTTFQHLFGTRAGVNVLEVSFGSIDPFGAEASELYDQACIRARDEGKRVKGILLCSPNNPLGQCYPREVLESVMKVCRKHNLHLISDEIYGLSTWDNPQMEHGVRFTSVLSLEVEKLMDPSMVHVVWGMSKDFGATGLRIGCLISQGNPAFLAAAEGISLFNFPSSLADRVATALLMNDEYVDNLVALNRHRLTDSYRYVTEFLRGHQIPFHESNAALFVWINLAAAVRSPCRSDDEILAKLRAKKVYITSGQTYASEEAGWFRLVIAHPREVLEEGLRRMILSLE